MQSLAFRTSVLLSVLIDLNMYGCVDGLFLSKGVDGLFLFILSKVHEKFVSQNLSSFFEKYGLLPAAQFAYSNDLGCTNALLTISHHVQTSFDAGMESYIVQLDFSAAFDRVSHSGLLFTLKSIGVSDNVQSIYTEVLSDHRKRVMVDGAASEWIPIISGVPQGSVFGLLLFILYTREMVELVENRLYAYADDSALYRQVFANQQTERCCCLH